MKLWFKRRLDTFILHVLDTILEILVYIVRLDVNCGMQLTVRSDRTGDRP